ncbi:hypothetical protein HBB16_16295 [Pseudonocardia sp. MCCB 268]|nr:hypothetical protein [Pseudonocardia cytotoxica]
MPFSRPSPERVRLVLRPATGPPELGAPPGCGTFSRSENRGAEIGVTPSHLHAYRSTLYP